MSEYLLHDLELGGALELWEMAQGCVGTLGDVIVLAQHIVSLWAYFTVLSTQINTPQLHFFAPMKVSIEHKLFC